MSLLSTNYLLYFHVERGKIVKVVIAVILIFSVILFCAGAVWVASNLASRYAVEIVEEDLAQEGLVGTRWGISGYTPPNYPFSNLEERKQYWEEINMYAQVYGIHTDWQDLDIISIAEEEYDGEISLVLGYQSPLEWGSERGDFLETVLRVLEETPQIAYLAIGNEVNALYEKYPDEFPQFVDDYKYLYVQIKEEHPDLPIYTTFNYESLIGEGYLFGHTISHVPQTHLLSEFGEMLDLVGLTVYPYFDHANVSDIPNDYFEPLSEYEIPLAITETGWMARTSSGERLSGIDELGLSGSEEEQVMYFEWLQALPGKENLVFINWVFLNDPYEWENGTDSDKFEAFDSIGLKYHDGSEKEIWLHWQQFFNGRSGE
mgnify:CR=1 FL=1